MMVILFCLIFLLYSERYSERHRDYATTDVALKIRKGSVYTVQQVIFKGI